jgi:hypothetical protein
VANAAADNDEPIKVDPPSLEILDNKRHKPDTSENTPEKTASPIDPSKTFSVEKVDVEPAPKAVEEESGEESPPQDLPAASTAQNIFGSIGSASTFSFGSTKPATTTTASSTSFVFGNTTSSATSLFGNSGTTNSTFSFGGLAKPGAAPSSTFSFGNTAGYVLRY